MSELECEFTVVKSDLSQKELDLTERSTTIKNLQDQVTAEQQKNSDLLTEFMKLEDKMSTTEKTLEVI